MALTLSKVDHVTARVGHLEITGTPVKITSTEITLTPSSITGVATGTRYPWQSTDRVTVLRGPDTWEYRGTKISK